MASPSEAHIDGDLLSGDLAKDGVLHGGGGLLSDFGHWLGIGVGGKGKKKI